MPERFSVFNPPRDGKGRVDWPLLEGLPLALALSACAGRKGGPLLVAAPDGYAARSLRDDINHLGVADAELFPDWEILPYDLYSPHPHPKTRTHIT